MGTISKHLEKHLEAMEETTKNTFAFHITVRMDEFFIDLLVNANAKLNDLDIFLRKIWLECCGHMCANIRQNIQILPNVCIQILLTTHIIMWVKG